MLERLRMTEVALLSAINSLNSKLSSHHSLSKREREVHINLAEELFIRLHTVLSHLKSLIEKLGARNVAHLVFLAYSYGFLTC